MEMKSKDGEKVGHGNNSHSIHATSKSKWVWLFIILVITSGFIVAYWYIFMRGRITTDDAYVHADSALISSRIPGTVVKVAVKENQWVTKGQLLLELDPRDYRVGVAEAKAVLERLNAQLKAQETSISLLDTQTRNAIKAANALYQEVLHRKDALSHKLSEVRKKRNAVVADLVNAKKNFRRVNDLYKQGIVSEERFDNANTVYKKAQSALNAIDASIKGLLS